MGLQRGPRDFVAGLIGIWFCAANQAYFMGLFPPVSAFFVPGSYDRKGARRFLKDRLIRLDIPLAIYSWIIDPLIGYMRHIWLEGLRPPTWSDLFGHFRYGAVIGSGPSWFIETLLISSLLYVLWHLASHQGGAAKAVQDTRFPGNAAIAVFAVLLAMANFLVRLWKPIDYEFRPLTLQFPFFAQYIALFIVGLIAFRRNWLLGLPQR